MINHVILASVCAGPMLTPDIPRTRKLMTTAPVAQTLSPPSCTVIIPTKDRLDLLKPCVESVLNSPYDGALEVLIVDNGSTDAAALSFLEDIQNDERVAVIRWDKPFNFSEINNMAARKARGDVLCFLNNDTEVKAPFWLTTLATLAARDDVGTAGPLLLFGDDTVQHAGLALDRDLVAGRCFTPCYSRSLFVRNNDLIVSFRVQKDRTDRLAVSCLSTIPA